MECKTLDIVPVFNDGKQTNRFKGMKLACAV